MDTVSQSIRDLARQVVAASQSGHPPTDPHVHEAVLVGETLRTSLTRLAGAEGFASLLRRALALARAEAPALESVKIGADGRLEGLERLDADPGTGTGGMGVGEAAIAITAHLLGLLTTFIGEPFMLRLVREAWPNASSDE